MSATKSDCNVSQGVLYMAMELSVGKWVLAFSTGGASDPRIREVAGGHIAGLEQEVRRAREKFGLPQDAPVVSCYEAGRDGFWLHRCLLHHGIQNVIIDSASIEHDRRRKHVKTDRVDARKLLRMLYRWHHGEQDVFRTVHVPSAADEDRRHLHRELQTLQGDRTRVVNRLRALLAARGRNGRVRLDQNFPAWLEAVRLWNGEPVPHGARQRLLRQFRRLQRYHEEIHELEADRRRRIRTENSRQARQVRKLLTLKAIGETTSWLLVFEVFAWRRFTSRREVASFTGLVGAPFSSGDVNREQGITKAGNRWIRSVIIEVAWMWLRYQPDSALSRWYHRRFGGPSKRLRKIGIVALARKLSIALWRYLEQGVPPAGAVLVEWHTKVGLRNAPEIAA